jgi:hypothetical protein
VYPARRFIGGPTSAADETNLQVVANHHLEDEKQLPIRDESVPIHIIHLEGNWTRSFSKKLATG